MQDQFRIVRNLVRSCVAAICLATLQSWQKLIGWIKVATPPQVPLVDDYVEIAAAALLVSALMLLFRYSEILAGVLVERLPIVSPAIRRLIAGRDHVEGDWPLIVVNTATGEVLLEGFLNIDFRRGELYVSGTDWKSDGTVALEFESIRSNYDNGVLRYFYAQGPTLRLPTMHGYTEIHFFPTGRRAERHVGEFLDKVNQIPMRFYAKRLPGGVLAPRVVAPSQRRSAAQAFRAEMAPQLPELLKEPQLVDWV